jgi:sporulation protein YlmC with PRC-barrel domain
MSKTNKNNNLKISEKLSGNSKKISGIYGQIKEKLSSTTGTDDVSSSVDQSQNEYNQQLSEELELTTKSDPYLLELEERFTNVSNDLNNLDKDFMGEEENFTGKEDNNMNISETSDVIKLVNKSEYGGMSVMRIKEKIIGKEVVDVNANVIGKIKDVDVNFENKTLQAFIIGKGGILEGLGSSGNDIIVPLHMVMAIGDKILVKSEAQL